MLEQNEDLLKGIIDTFKQILDITPEKDLDYLLNDTVDPPKVAPIADLAVLSPEEIRSIIEVGEQEDCGGDSHPNKTLAAISKPAPRPSYEVLKRMSMEIQGVEIAEPAGRASDSKRGKEVGDPEPAAKSRITCVTLFKKYDHPFEESKGDSVAEAMVIQGALSTVCEILLTARRELQIDLMMIIAKLLVKSTHNQAEFK